MFQAEEASKDSAARNVSTIPKGARATSMRSSDVGWDHQMLGSPDVGIVRCWDRQTLGAKTVVEKIVLRGRFHAARLAAHWSERSSTISRPDTFPNVSHIEQFVPYHSGLNGRIFKDEPRISDQKTGTTSVYRHSRRLDEVDANPCGITCVRLNGSLWTTDLPCICRLIQRCQVFYTLRNRKSRNSRRSRVGFRSFQYNTTVKQRSRSAPN